MAAYCPTLRSLPALSSNLAAVLLPVCRPVCLRHASGCLSESICLRLTEFASLQSVAFRHGQSAVLPLKSAPDRSFFPVVLPIITASSRTIRRAVKNPAAPEADRSKTILLAAVASLKKLRKEVNPFVKPSPSCKIYLLNIRIINRLNRQNVKKCPLEIRFSFANVD